MAEPVMIGPCEAYHGDARAIVPTLSGRYGAVITDAPFGTNHSSGHGSEEWGDGSIEGDADTSVRDVVLQMLDDVPVLCFGSWKAPRPAGTRMRLVWDSLGALGMGDLRIPWKPADQEIYVLGDPSGFCGKRTNNVLQCPPVQSMAKNGRVHPHQKPVRLLSMLVEKVKADTILDPFAGSFSTAVACVKAGRRAIVIESDAKWFRKGCSILRDAVRGETTESLFPATFADAG